jgi:hypothetical protein
MRLTELLHLHLAQLCLSHRRAWLPLQRGVRGRRCHDAWRTHDWRNPHEVTTCSKQQIPFASNAVQHSVHCATPCNAGDGRVAVAAPARKQSDSRCQPLRPWGGSSARLRTGRESDQSRARSRSSPSALAEPPRAPRRSRSRRTCRRPCATRRRVFGAQPFRRYIAPRGYIWLVRTAGALVRIVGPRQTLVRMISKYPYVHLQYLMCMISTLIRNYPYPYAQDPYPSSQLSVPLYA